MQDRKDKQETTARLVCVLFCVFCVSHPIAAHCRRKLMEQVAVQLANYQLLQSKNSRAVAKKKDYQYYEIPKLYAIRPVMPQK